MPPLRRERHARRRPDHRRRPHRRGKGRAARLVRRVHAERAVPHRGQEDDGVRAGGADELGVAGLDHLSDRRRHRHGRHVEGVRRDRADRLGGARQAAADGVGAGRALRADRARVSAGHRESAAVGRRVDPGRRPARAARDRRLPDPARRARERRHGARRHRSIDGRRDARDRKHEGVSAAPEGGAALAAMQRLVADGSIKPQDSVVLFNTGGALEVSRRVSMAQPFSVAEGDAQAPSRSAADRNPSARSSSSPPRLRAAAR